jgi:nitroreductase
LDREEERIVSNLVLKVIRERRSNFRFQPTQIGAEQLKTVLEAGRWAPSWANTQPWRFIVIKDIETKEKICSEVKTILNLSIKEAPFCIVVCVDTKKDSAHFVEDGAAATQNMALAAHSIGLGTCWIGVFSIHDERRSSERKIRKTLNIPDQWRIISILPLGIPKLKGTKSRKELASMVDLNSFGNGTEEYPELDLSAV